MSRQIQLTKFRNLSLDDPFFDSLKNGYRDFAGWFSAKSDEDLYIVTDGNNLSGMIYLKIEEGEVTDITPPLSNRKWMKVGTLKIVGQGTRLGERVIKKIFDTAISLGADGIYITVFDLHENLIALFERYGFERSGTKTTENGTELVLSRSLTDFVGNTIHDYPFIHTSGSNVWLLAIYPEYHTRLLPDSILRGEPAEIVQDVSHTNTIHKVYISGLSLARMNPGDIVIFYRTNDGKGRAFYRSVVTSVCVVEEVKRRREFADVDAFLAYTLPRSVFDETELRDRYASGKRLNVAKLTYNVALGRRITRGALLENQILSENPRWDLRQLTTEQLQRILRLGEVNERLIID